MLRNTAISPRDLNPSHLRPGKPELFFSTPNTDERLPNMPPRRRAPSAPIQPTTPPSPPEAPNSSWPSFIAVAQAVLAFLCISVEVRFKLSMWMLLLVLVLAYIGHMMAYQAGFEGKWLSPRARFPTLTVQSSWMGGSSGNVRQGVKHGLSVGRILKEIVTRARQEPRTSLDVVSESGTEAQRPLV